MNASAYPTVGGRIVAEQLVRLRLDRELLQ
jgi:hypothetical protein